MVEVRRWSSLRPPIQRAWQWSSGGWWGSWWPVVQRCEARPGAWRPWLAATPCQWLSCKRYLFPKEEAGLDPKLTRWQPTGIWCNMSLTSKNLLVRNSRVAHIRNAQGSNRRANNAFERHCSCTNNETGYRLSSLMNWYTEIIQARKSVGKHSMPENEHPH